MFRRLPPKTVQCHMKKISEKTAFIQLDDPIWKFAKLPNFIRFIISKHRSRVIVDLSPVQEMTTATFAMLLLMKHQLEQKGASVCIQGLHGQPKLLCNILKLNDLLCCKSPEK